MYDVVEALKALKKLGEILGEITIDDNGLPKIILEGERAKYYKIVENALNGLKTTKEAKPSRAMENLDELEKVIEEITINNVDLKNTLKISVLITSIKQTLQQSIIDNDILNLLKSNMKVEMDYYDDDFGTSQGFEYVDFNGNGLEFKSKDDEHKIIKWLKDGDPKYEDD